MNWTSFRIPSDVNWYEKMKWNSSFYGAVFFHRQFEQRMDRRREEMESTDMYTVQCTPYIHVFVYNDLFHDIQLRLCYRSKRYDCLILNSYNHFIVYIYFIDIDNIIADVINSLSYSLVGLCACAWTWEEFVTHSVQQIFGIECSRILSASLRSLQKTQAAIFNLSECHKFSGWLNNGFCLRLEFMRASIYITFPLENLKYLRVKFV